jgi:hypothetical protein
VVHLESRSHSPIRRVQSVVPCTPKISWVLPQRNAEYWAFRKRTIGISFDHRVAGTDFWLPSGFPMAGDSDLNRKLSCPLDVWGALTLRQRLLVLGLQIPHWQHTSWYPSRPDATLTCARQSRGRRAASAGPGRIVWAARSTRRALPGHQPGEPAQHAGVEVEPC